MKKGVEALIAWVLLIGFAVTLGVFVSRWSLQQAQKSTEGTTQMIEEDIQCSDVAISGYCEGTNVKVKNRGTLNIIGFRKGDDKVMFGEGDYLKPNVGEKTYSVSEKIILVPIIKIEDKIVICTTRKQEFKCP